MVWKSLRTAGTLQGSPATAVSPMPRTPGTPLRLTAVALLGLALLTGCGEGDKPAVPELPRFDDDHLSAGRSVWMSTCRSCHLVGVNDVLGVAQFDQWDQRLAKGREALYRSVLLGTTGPDGAVTMPPRGGNLQLSDAQLQAAVDYTLAAVEALRSGKTP